MNKGNWMRFISNKEIEKKDQLCKDDTLCRLDENIMISGFIVMLWAAAQVINFCLACYLRLKGDLQKAILGDLKIIRLRQLMIENVHTRVEGRTCDETWLPSSTDRNCIRPWWKFLNAGSSMCWSWMSWIEDDFWGAPRYIFPTETGNVMASAVVFIFGSTSSWSWRRRVSESRTSIKDRM